jgi:hypothetical protein
VPIIVDGHYPRATLHALSTYGASRPGGLRRRLTLGQLVAQELKGGWRSRGARAR